MISVILVGILVLVGIYAALAPIESLAWWSRQGQDEVSAVVQDLLGPVDAEGPAQRRVYLVYLSGVGSLDGTANSRREKAVLAAVERQVPQVVIAADVFPYSVTNRGLLTGSRTTTWLWKRLRLVRRNKPFLGLHLLINARNFFQMFVSADPRYGPTFNLGVAKEIQRSLIRHGYQHGSGCPVLIVGYSGGGQIAIGSAWYLGLAGFDVSVVSIGGMLSDDPGLDRVDHLWHVYGSKDGLADSGRYLFPGRWPTAPLSSWNKALREGRATVEEIGPMRHNGVRDYFDAKAVDSQGRTHAELTTQALIDAARSVAARSGIESD